MADLTKDAIRSQAMAMGIDIDEPLLSEVTHNLNALKDLLEDLSPPGLDEVEPLPIIPPPQRSRHGQG